MIGSQGALTERTPQPLNTEHSKMKLFTGLLLALLISANGYAQNLDSLKRIVLDPLQPDTERLFTFYDHIYDGYLNTKPDSALFLADSLIRFAHRAKQPRHEANGHVIKGNVYLGRGDHDPAYTEYMQAMELFGAAGRLKGQASCWNNIAIIHTRKGEHENAISAYGKALEISEQIGDQRRVANTLNNIGALYFLQNDFLPAIDNFQQALALNRQINEPLYAAQSLQNIGSCYLQMKNYEQAVAYSDSSLVLFEAMDAQTSLPGVLATLGSCLLALDRPDAAEKHLMRAKELADRFDDKPNGTLVYGSLARLWLRRGDAHKAVNYSEHGLAQAEAVQGVAELRDATEVMYEAYKAVGNGTKALAMYERFIGLRDSLMKEENQRSLLRFEYESENSKRALADSLTFAAEKTIQTDLIAEQAQQKRNAWIGAGLVLAIALLLLWLLLLARRNAIRLSEKNDQVLRAQKDLMLTEKALATQTVRTHVAQDIHDELGSQLTKIGLLSREANYARTEAPQELSELLASIDRIAMNTGSTLSDVVWNTDPHNDLVSSLIVRAKEHAQRMLHETGIKLYLEHPQITSDREVPPDWRRNAIHIVKEAINNALKYAKATELHLRVAVEKDQFIIELRDDGKGFDVATAQHGNGLGNMRDRAERVGGTFTISSDPSGTVIKAMLPLP